MKISELKQIIREEVANVMKEATATLNDRKTIEAYILSSPAFENASPGRVKSIVNELFAEWKSVASNYANVESYLKELEKTGGLEAFIN